MKRALSLLCALTLPCLLPAQENRTALVIGVSKYDGKTFASLNGPTADANAMAAKLMKLGFEVTLKLDATRREMLDLTDAFGATLAKRQGVGLFYFSGHGSSKPDETDPNYLIPAGTNLATREDLPQEAFNAQRVANRMIEAGNRLNLIFLDACRDNSLPGRTKNAGDGLAAMRGASGLMFFFATQPNRVAFTDATKGSSLFTSAILRHIETPGLSFMDMMADVTADTEALSLANGGAIKQSPFMSGTLSGRFAFLPELRSSPVPQFSETKAGATMTIDLPGGEKMTFCYCPEGSFTMGSPASEKGRQPVDEDQVSVRLSKGFWMAQSECTQGQWQAVMGNNPSHFKDGKEFPVEEVNWDDVQTFITRMPAQPHLRRMKFSLPTEAQWEYACRAGTKSVFAFGNALTSVQANFNGNSPYGGAKKGVKLGRTTKVGSYGPNSWGLYDMHGNVQEWCLDTMSSHADGSALPGGIDPLGSVGPHRVSRGGCWNYVGEACRTASRTGLAVEQLKGTLGFRLAMIPTD